MCKIERMAAGLIKSVILCFDNSELSMTASDAAVRLAVSLNLSVTGIHAFNASMHEGAFRIMEPTLPVQYQKEEILKKQRDAHNTLINVGMERISISYLKPCEELFSTAGVSYKSKIKEGKNFIAINEMIRENEDDATLVVLGASGFNHREPGFIGSVCMRVIRTTDADYLVVKRAVNFDSPNIVVCLDGSETSISALKMAKETAETFDAQLHLLYVFDTALHRDVFARLKDSLIEGDGFTFNTKEQEKAHDDFIDVGLEKVGVMIIDRAEKEALNGNQAGIMSAGWGLVGDRLRLKPVIKQVLSGHIYKSICDYAAKVSAELIFIGRTGRHYIEGVDIGSVAENVIRYAPCSVFVSRAKEHKGWVM
ncbi:universal stress protein [Candidatus Magnetominusculus xianensis]|nr:universal stress protein [Candidatus Magnetominusculus xianensis]MBF0402678.1 universal stress protein [Nitrospirota bacterium]